MTKRYANEEETHISWGFQRLNHSGLRPSHARDFWYFYGSCNLPLWTFESGPDDGSNARSWVDWGHFEWISPDIHFQETPLITSLQSRQYNFLFHSTLIIIEAFISIVLEFRGQFYHWIIIASFVALSIFSRETGIDKKTLWTASLVTPSTPPCHPNNHQKLIQPCWKKLREMLNWNTPMVCIPPHDLRNGKRESPQIFQYHQNLFSYKQYDHSWCQHTQASDGAVLHCVDNRFHPTTFSN